MPRVIGIITSPTGAVIRDILHRLGDRFPRHVLVWPVRVQGETSAAEVAAAIRGFNAHGESRPDVLIVARGGGSLEDLWSFNEEVVVRAAAESTFRSSRPSVTRPITRSSMRRPTAAPDADRRRRMRGSGELRSL